jgi:hypothetical protein
MNIMNAVMTKMTNVVKEFTRDNLDINGTHLQGYIEISYANLVRVLGDPKMMDDKVQVCWGLKFSDGTIITIYDYDWVSGNSRRNPSDITFWHIGGHSEEAVRKAKSLFVSSCLLGQIETFRHRMAKLN